MRFYRRKASPMGELLLTADELGLTGLWFVGARRTPDMASVPDAVPGAPERFREAELWLERYFSGEDPDFFPRLHLMGTDFQCRVWTRLLRIPFGGTATYGELAMYLGEERGERVSARAVGGAVGRNPVSIIVPCHRVIGADGSLTGYAGGLDRKKALLGLEQGHVIGI